MSGILTDAWTMQDTITKSDRNASQTGEMRMRLGSWGHMQTGEHPRLNWVVYKSKTYNVIKILPTLG